MITFEHIWEFLATYWEAFISISSFIAVILFGIISFQVQMKNYQRKLERLIKRDNYRFKKLIIKTGLNNDSIIFKSYLRAKMVFVLNNENGKEQEPNYYISFREYKLIKLIFRNINHHLVKFNYILKLIRQYNIAEQNIKISKKSKLSESLDLYPKSLENKTLLQSNQKDYFLNSLYDYAGNLMVQHQITEETIWDQYNFFLKHDRDDMIIIVIVKANKNEEENITKESENKIFFSINTAETKKVIKTKFKNMKLYNYL